MYICIACAKFSWYSHEDWMRRSKILKSFILIWLFRYHFTERCGHSLEQTNSIYMKMLCLRFWVIWSSAFTLVINEKRLQTDWQYGQRKIRGAHLSFHPKCAKHNGCRFDWILFRDPFKNISFIWRRYHYFKWL